MVRNRKKAKVKGVFEAETMKEGVKLVLEGESIRTAAKKFNLKFQTLGRYVKKIKKMNPGDSIEMKARHDVRKIFSDDQEEDIVKYLITSAKMFYGLTTLETRQLAYEMAKINQIDVPESWNKEGMAGKDWLYGFFKRHPDLTLQTANAYSLARASFNPCCPQLENSDISSKPIISRPEYISPELIRGYPNPQQKEFIRNKDRSKIITENLEKKRIEKV